MINENRLLNEANSFFTQRKFEKALFLYSQLSSNFPQNKEYPIYALFCDIATEDEEKAISLYDYFSIVKDENLEEAIRYVEDVVNAYDGDIDKMMEILKELSSSTIESLDAIRYEDFKKLIDSRGSFRIAFEDIMFSTKVAIENKDDFFDFVTKLIDNDFNTTAYTYLDGFNEYFSYDKEIEKLYKKLEEKKIATNHKQ
jgi:tetratricopeptide (TPR) repeat protein